MSDAGIIIKYPDGIYKLMGFRLVKKDGLLEVGKYEVWHRLIKKTNEWTKKPSCYIKKD